MTAIPFGQFDDATAMLGALGDGAVSAVELLEHHLERIGRHNPTLNAIVHARLRQRAGTGAGRRRGAGAGRRALPYWACRSPSRTASTSQG